MPNSPLISIDEAAIELGVKKAALRAVADEYGFTHRIGRSVLLHRAELGELIEACRVKPKDPACTGDRSQDERPTTKSATTETSAFQPAVQAARKLRQRSRNTSPQSPAPVVPLERKN